MRVSMSRSGRFLNHLLFLSTLLLAAGCSKSGTVSGKVYYKGQPLTVGIVQFFPEGKGGDFSSPIEKDGSYRISKLAPGPVKASVISNTTNPIMNMPPMAGGPFAEKGMKGAAEMMKKSKPEGEASPTAFDAKGGVSTPAKYGSPETSGIKFDVTGGEQTFDIKLE